MFQKKKKERKKCSGTRPWGRWHYIINILSKYILPQPENCFSQECWIPNAWKNEAGVLPRVCGQWDPISNNKKSPTSISPAFNDSSSRHREKMHIETEHTTGELAPWHLPGACQTFSDKEQISLSTKDDRVGNNWSMNFIKPKKNQLDQLPSHQASQPETPLYKYALTSIQCLP